MAEEQPRFALAVADVPAWLAFLTERAGFELADRRRARLRTPSGALFALGAEGRRPEELNFMHRDVAALRDRLAGASLAETSWGDRILTAPAPEGTIRFIQPVEHPPAETFRRYLAGPDELETALAGLTEAELDRSVADGEWSIRQIAHHLPHGELILAGQIRMALAEPGREYNVDWGSRQPDLGDATRPLAPTLALLRAMRAYLAPIVAALPDALERYTVDRLGNRTTVTQSIATVARHMAEHTDEIRRVTALFRP